MIKKIIGAVSLFVVFIVTFAIGVGCIVKGIGDFSWDAIDEYVSLSDLVKINDTPISELFGFSDHSKIVNSHAEGQVSCPTDSGKIVIEDMPITAVIIASEDEYIHITFEGEIRESGVVDSHENLTGTNIPNMDFKYDDSTDKAIISFNRFRTDNNDCQITIAIPLSFGGELAIEDMAGSLKSEITLELAKLSISNVAGEVNMSGISALELVAEDSAGKMNFDNVKFGSFNIQDIMGKIDIKAAQSITADCEIANIMGIVNIEFPEGSVYNVQESDVVGIVTADGDSSAEYTIKISDVMGTVAIKKY